MARGDPGLPTAVIVGATGAVGEDLRSRLRAAGSNGQRVSLTIVASGRFYGASQRNRELTVFGKGGENAHVLGNELGSRDPFEYVRDLTAGHGSVEEIDSVSEIRLNILDEE